jgi:hypothetical protein
MKKSELKTVSIDVPDIGNREQARFEPCLASAAI